MFKSADGVNELSVEMKGCSYKIACNEMFVATITSNDYLDTIKNKCLRIRREMDSIMFSLLRFVTHLQQIPAESPYFHHFWLRKR